MITVRINFTTNPSHIVSKTDEINLNLHRMLIKSDNPEPTISIVIRIITVMKGKKTIQTTPSKGLVVKSGGGEVSWLKINPFFFMVFA